MIKQLLKNTVLLGVFVFLAYDIVHIGLTRFDSFGLVKVFNNNNISTLEGKLGLAVTVLFYLGIFLLTVVLLTSLARVFSGRVDPTRDQETRMIKCGNQIIRNTMQQSAVFLSFYFYWLYNQTDNKRLREAVLYPLLFLIGRVLFAVGYLVGVKVHVPQLRLLGFLLHLTTIAILLGDIIHTPLLTKYFA